MKLCDRQWHQVDFKQRYIDIGSTSGTVFMLLTHDSLFERSQNQRLC